MAEITPLQALPGGAVPIDQILDESIMQQQWARLGADTRLKFNDTLLTGLRNGESSQQIARRISGGTIDGIQVKGFMDTTRRKANTLVRTGSNAVLNRSRLQSFQQNPELIDAIQQISTLDGRTSEICVAYSGQAWKLETLEPIGDTLLPYNNGPPRHFNCRSTIVPVLKSFEELGLPAVDFPEGTRASVDGQVPGDITFEKFLRGKTQTFQNQLLGTGKAKLWRDGKITLSQLVDMTGNPLTLEQLEQTVTLRKPPRAVPKKRAEPKPFTRPGQDEAVRKMHEEAFSEAPSAIKRALAKLPIVKRLTNTGAGSWYNGGGRQLNMVRHVRQSADEFLAIWRHEVGHHIDSMLAIQQQVEGVRAAFHVSARYRSVILKEARRLNAKVFGTKAKPGAIQRRSFADIQDQAVDDAFEMKEIGIKKWTERELELLRALRPDVDLDADELVSAVFDELAGSSDLTMRTTISRIIQGLRDDNPLTIFGPMAGLQTKRNVSLIMADYFGAITNNRIGYGHTKGYYKTRGFDGRSTEAFANFVSLWGQENQTWRKILEAFTPETGRSFRMVLEDNDFAFTGRARDLAKRIFPEFEFADDV